MIRFFAAALAFVLPSAALAGEGVSPWARDGATALRLIDGGAAEAGGRLAAIEIALDPGWKTYWRQPGASGVPPRFDFSGSTNVAEAHVAYPAPERAEGEDGVTNVYHGEVTLPVVVRPKDPSRPVWLKLTADYGVCEQVCVPVRAEAALDLAPDGAPAAAEAEEARAAAAAAPKPLALGSTAALAVSSVRRAGVGKDGGAALEISVAAPAGPDRPLLFAETGDGDFAPAPEPVGEPKDGRATFRMVFDEPELPKSGLRFTLAVGGQAIETPVALDAIAPAP